MRGREFPAHSIEDSYLICQCARRYYKNMREAAGSPHFPTAHCDTCGKSVLTHVSFDEAGAARRFCVHCDSPIESGLRWLTAAELEGAGYLIGAQAPRTGGGCGCGSEGGSCSMRKH